MKNVIILGSGRSGTSMLAGSLANAGFYLGDYANYLGKNKANPKGFFEDYEVNTINEDILKKTIPFTIPEKIRRKYFKSFTFYRARWLARIPAFIKIRTNKSIDNRIMKVINNEPFCLKDPRFSYTLPIWQKYFNVNTRYIVVFREPNKTAESIVRECKESLALKPIKMDKKSALSVWEFMYNNILKNYAADSNKQNWMFIHYNQIFDVQKVKELESFIDCKIDLSFPDKKISRSNEGNKPTDEKIDLIYNKLIKISTI